MRQLEAILRGRRLERHGDPVHAIAKAARSGAIGKNMAEVGVAGVADGFDPLQKAGTIETVRDDIGLHGLRKRRPSWCERGGRYAVTS